MVLFVDTNVILDFILNREPFFSEAKSFLLLCAKNEAVLAPHTVTNVFFITRKDFSQQERKAKLLEVLACMDVVPTGKPQIIKALKNEAIGDFEDALQLECARDINADFIVTRDPRHFSGSEIKTMTPKEFLEKHGRAFATDGGMKTLANEGGK